MGIDDEAKATKSYIICFKNYD